MLNTSISSPWQIEESDHEDELPIRYIRRISLARKPPTPPPILPRYSEARRSQSIRTESRLNESIQTELRLNQSIRSELRLNESMRSESRLNQSIQSELRPRESRYSDLITPDWSPEIREGGQKPKFGRQKTAPSLERAPSHHRSIFSGSSSSKFLSNSLCEPHQQPRIIHTYTPDTPPASPSSPLDPFTMIQEDIKRFIYTHIPKECSPFFRCFLRRDKSGIHRGLFPTYYLHAERPGDGRKLFLLAARKVAKLHRRSEYIITTNIETLSEKSGGDGNVGKLRENGMTNTEYTLYDNGKNPSKYGYKQSHSRYGVRRELAGIFYNTNILGLKGPRETNAIIPKLGCDIQPVENEDRLIDQWRNVRFTDILHLRNQSPNYTQNSKAPMLQFNSSSPIRSSVKNFQMMMETEDHQEEIVMQFGRVKSDTFICDFRYPLSPIQAFGIALSSFDSGVARE